MNFNRHPLVEGGISSKKDTRGLGGINPMPLPSHY